MNKFQPASLSAVSPHEDSLKEQEDKGEDAMEEDFQRVFGEGTKEVVEREIGEEAVRAKARKTGAAPSQKEVEEHNLDIV